MIDYVVSDLIDATARALVGRGAGGRRRGAVAAGAAAALQRPVREEHLELKRYLREHLYRTTACCA